MSNEAPTGESLNDERFVSVLEINNTTLIPIVKSLLDEAGIHYFIKNERLHDLVGYLRLSSGGYNSWWQPEVLVQSSRVEEARELLNLPLESAASEGSDGQTSQYSIRKPSGLIVVGLWIIFGPTLIWQLAYIVFNDGGDKLSDLLMLAFVILLGSVLWKVTRNYFAARRVGQSEIDS